MHTADHLKASLKDKYCWPITANRTPGYHVDIEFSNRQGWHMVPDHVEDPGVEIINALRHAAPHGLSTAQALVLLVRDNLTLQCTWTSWNGKPILGIEFFIAGEELSEYGQEHTELDELAVFITQRAYSNRLP